MTAIWIRGKHNEYISQEGNFDFTIDEQKILEKWWVEMKKANNRLKNLEKLEYFRMEKVRKEIERLEDDWKKEEEERIKKKKSEALKRKIIEMKKQELEEAKLKWDADWETNAIQKRAEEEEKSWKKQ